MHSFFRELRHRRVYRVALGYGIAASALVQIGGTILPIFHAPDWVQQVFIVLIAVGFPISLVLAWIFDLTTSGIQRTPNVTGLRVSGRQQVWMLALFGTLVAALAVTGYLVWHPWKKSADDAVSLPTGSTLPKSIAVLPFQNLSADPENAFFADGVQEQILTNLANVSDLTVISHASVQQYRNATGRNLRAIGQQLGVAYVLEGSVQRVANQLRVTAQLTDVRANSQVWADTFDHDAAAPFKIQSDIAESIVAQLQAKLSPQEKATIEQQPTRDTVSYRLYLQAKDIVDTYTNAEDPRAALLGALSLLNDATKRDPEYALAYCETTRAHDLLYFLGLDPSPARNALAKAAMEEGLKLRPDLPEVRVAAADYYFRCLRDYDSALQQLAIARPRSPNSVAFFVLAGYVERRKGQWSAAERDFASAVKVDPRNPNAINFLVDTYVLERRFDEAKKGYDRAIASASQAPIIYIRRASLDFAETGDGTSLLAALNKWPDVDVTGGETSWRILLALVDRNFDEASRVLAQSPRADFQDVDFTFYFPRAWYEASIARARGERSKMAIAFESARGILESRLKTKPDDPRTLAVLAQVDAGLGKKELAIREAQHATELMPVSKDAYDGPLVLQGLAQVYTWTGEKTRAIETLQTLVSMPGYLSYGYLRVDPIWNPLRDDPRFAQILAAVAPKQLTTGHANFTSRWLSDKPAAPRQYLPPPFLTI